MGIGKGPSWDTPARLDGLPAKNWSTREGVSLQGTFSACLKRWLELPCSNRESCSLGWGPNADGQHGCWERPNIVGFLMRNGPPPEMGPGVTLDYIKAWLTIGRPEPAKAFDDDIPPGHSAGGDGGAAAYRAWLDRRKRD